MLYKPIGSLVYNSFSTCRVHIETESSHFISSYTVLNCEYTVSHQPNKLHSNLYLYLPTYLQVQVHVHVLVDRWVDRGIDLNVCTSNTYIPL